MAAGHKRNKIKKEKREKNRSHVPPACLRVEKKLERMVALPPGTRSSQSRAGTANRNGRLSASDRETLQPSWFQQLSGDILSRPAHLYGIRLHWGWEGCTAARQHRAKQPHLASQQHVDPHFHISPERRHTEKQRSSSSSSRRRPKLPHYWALLKMHNKQIFNFTVATTNASLSFC